MSSEPRRPLLPEGGLAFLHVLAREACLVAGARRPFIEFGPGDLVQRLLHAGDRERRLRRKHLGQRRNGALESIGRHELIE